MEEPMPAAGASSTPAKPIIPKIDGKLKDGWDTLSSKPEVNRMYGCRKTLGSVKIAHL